MQAQDELVFRLVPELFQAERSAIRHTRIEASRLGMVPPAVALDAVGAHAEATLPTLEALTTRLGLPGQNGGQLAGATFSVLRDRLGDRLFDPERSYRATLLGIHHGVETALLLCAAAARTERYEVLAEHVADWLEVRLELAQGCVDQLDWFGANADLALEPPASLARRLGHGVGALVRTLLRVPEPA